MDQEIEDAFGRLTGVLLGRKLTGIQSYSGWLEQNTKPYRRCKSAVSGKTIYVSPFDFYTPTHKHVITLEESSELAGKAIPVSELSALNLANAAAKLEKIKLYSPEVKLGENTGIEECSTYGYSSYCFHGDTYVNSKYCAYDLWARDSEYIFGSEFIFDSKFCLKCFHSLNLTRCFEVSHSSSSSDCYFCHNIEACSECMFCFNAKSLRYAIGNVEYPKEEYLKLKKRILASMADRLERSHSLPYSIFSAGAPKVSK